MNAAYEQLNALLDTIELLNRHNPPSNEACSVDNNDREVAKFATWAARVILIVANVDGVGGCRLCKS